MPLLCEKSSVHHASLAGETVSSGAGGIDGSRASPRAGCGWGRYMARCDPLAGLRRRDPLHPQNIHVKLCLIIVHTARLRSLAAIRLFFAERFLPNFDFVNVGRNTPRFWDTSASAGLQEHYVI